MQQIDTSGEYTKSCLLRQIVKGNNSCSLALVSNSVEQ